MTTRPTSSGPRRACNPFRSRRAAGAAALLASVLVVSACGGSSETGRTFDAQRIIALGDENSLIVDSANSGNGAKYTVNGIVSTADPRIDCTLNPLWVQSLARHYGLNFPQCNIGSRIELNPQSRIQAAYGARATDLAQQIGTQLATGSLTDTDLVTVLVGMWDVVAEYQKYPFVGEDELVKNVEAAGAETARQVNRLADLDTRIIVSTIPDISYSPWARNEAATHTDTDRAELIRRLVARYNTSLRAGIRNDGTHIGLVLADEMSQTIVKVPGTNGIVDSSVAVCDLSKSAQVPRSSLDCTPLTLISGGTEKSHLWADDLHLAPVLQGVMGNAAISRATNNPF